MRPVKFEHLKNNTHLTDFQELKQSVIDNVLKNVPKIQKDSDTSKQTWFSSY